jgi:hypothetical protein
MPDAADADGGSQASLRDRAFLALYFGSHKIPSALCSALKATEAGIQSAVTGIWLGLLTPDLLGKLDAWYYNHGFAEYRDRAYNVSGLFTWEQEVVDTYFARLSSVLIAAGAGAGREMLALNRMGIQVEGYEYNPHLVRLGNQLLSEEGWQPNIYAGPANELPPGMQLYDGTIVGWATYTLIAGKAARTLLLRQIRARCAPGAPVLLSFFCRSGNTGSVRLTAAIANSLRTLLRRPKVEIGDTLSVSYAHRFTRQEIEEELTISGFQPVCFRSDPCGHAVGIAV